MQNCILMNAYLPDPADKIPLGNYFDTFLLCVKVNKPLSCISPDADENNKKQ